MAAEKLRELARLPENKFCAECGERGPLYVDVTVGTFICTDCSGLLRGLPTPHRVKSISAASFTAEEITFMEKTGNKYCKAHYLATWAEGDPLPTPKNKEQFKAFLVQKYERRKWMVEGDVTAHVQPVQRLLGHNVPPLIVKDKAAPSSPSTARHSVQSPHTAAAGLSAATQPGFAPPPYSAHSGSTATATASASGPADPLRPAIAIRVAPAAVSADPAALKAVDFRMIGGKSPFASAPLPAAPQPPRAVAGPPAAAAPLAALASAQPAPAPPQPAPAAAPKDSLDDLLGLGGFSGSVPAAHHPTPAPAPAPAPASFTSNAPSNDLSSLLSGPSGPAPAPSNPKDDIMSLFGSVSISKPAAPAPPAQQPWGAPPPGYAPSPFAAPAPAGYQPGPAPSGPFAAAPPAGYQPGQANGGPFAAAPPAVYAPSFGAPVAGMPYAAYGAPGAPFAAAPAAAAFGAMPGAPFATNPHAAAGPFGPAAPAAPYSASPFAPAAFAQGPAVPQGRGPAPSLL